VIDFDLFHRLQVVVHDTLATSTDDEVPYFNRAQPVDVERRQEAVAEIEIEVSHVFDFAHLLGVAGAESREAARESPHEVIQNGQIVRRQIPHHINVMLEQTQVDAHAVDEKQVADLAGIDDLLDFLNRAAVDKGVIDHQYAAMAACSGDELL